MYDKNPPENGGFVSNLNIITPCGIMIFRPLTKLKSAVKFFVKNLFKLREIWYNVGIENSVIMGCRNAFGRNKPTNKNGVCMYRGFGTERPYFKKDR